MIDTNLAAAMAPKRKDAEYYCNAADNEDYYSTEEDADEAYESDSEYVIGDDGDAELAEEPIHEGPKKAYDFNFPFLFL